MLNREISQFITHNKPVTPAKLGKCLHDMVAISKLGQTHVPDLNPYHVNHTFDLTLNMLNSTEQDMSVFTASSVTPCSGYQGSPQHRVIYYMK